MLLRYSKAGSRRKARARNSDDIPGLAPTSRPGVQIARQGPTFSGAMGDVGLAISSLLQATFGTGSNHEQAP
jgi:hypothetical protein